MAKMTKALVDQDIRARIFEDLILQDNLDFNYVKVNDRQYGVILTDANGEQRYARIGVVVAEMREDMTAQELMDSEIEDYRIKQDAKAEKAKAKAEKIAKDKARREEKAKAELEKIQQEGE